MNATAAKAYGKAATEAACAPDKRCAGAPEGEAAVPVNPLWNVLALSRHAGAPDVQAKLSVGAIADPLERQADATADAVMRMPANGGAPLDDDLPAAGAGATVHRKCDECASEDDEHVRLTADSGLAGASLRAGSNVSGLGGEAAAAPASVHATLRSPSVPLDAGTRAFFEPRFGRDLSHVRIHTDANAAASARDVGAKAYTVGQHLAFAPGRYTPATDTGRRLLAHELTHVVQQAGRTWLQPVVRLQARHGRSRSRRQHGLSEASRQELRQLALRPSRLANLWNHLSGDEQSEVILAMDAAYGRAFTDRFYWYASRGQLSGGGAHVLPQQAEGTPYPDVAGLAVGHPRDRGYIHIETYSNGTQVWLHPSGREIWLTSPRAPETESVGLARVRNLLLGARQMHASGDFPKARELLEEARAETTSLDDSEQEIAERETRRVAILLWDPLGLFD